jgi:hypothetical protein
MPPSPDKAAVLRLQCLLLTGMPLPRQGRSAKAAVPVAYRDAAPPRTRRQIPPSDFRLVPPCTAQAGPLRATVHRPGRGLFYGFLCVCLFGQPAVALTFVPPSAQPAVALTFAFLAAAAK